MVAFTPASLALLAALPAAFASRYVIKPSGAEDLCVAPAAVPANGTDIVLAPCYGDLIFWNIDANGTFVSANSTQCLDQKDARHRNGNKIQTYECAPGSAPQNFTLVDAGVNDKNETQVAIRWADERLCLDVTDGQFVNGTKIQAWRCAKKSPNQSFLLYDVTEASNTTAVDDEDDAAEVFNAYLAAQFTLPINGTANGTTTDAPADETTDAPEGDAPEARRRHHQRRVVFGSH